MKDIRIRPKIAEHDLETKIRSVRRLLPKHKVKVTIFFRGREVTHPDIGKGILARVIKETEDISRVEAKSAKGNMLFVILVSDTKVSK